MAKLPKRFRFQQVAVKGQAKCPSCISILSSTKAWNRHLSGCFFFKKEFPEVLRQPSPPPESPLWSLPSIPSLPDLFSTSSAPFPCPEATQKAPEATPKEVSDKTKRRLAKRLGETILQTVEEFTHDPKHHPEIWGPPETFDQPPFKILFNKPSQQIEARNTVAAMDLTSISKRGYASLAAAQPSMLRTNAVEEERAKETKEMESLAPKSPLGKTGFWRRLSHLLPLLLPAYKVPEGKVKVKISGDGRLCGRRRHQTMITFSVLSAGAVSCSPEHHYTLALWNGQEDYHDFHDLLQGLFADLRDVQKNGIEVGGVHRQIELYLSGDWKFLALVLGITSPSARKGFCLWCLAQSDAIAGSDTFFLRDMQQVLEEFRKKRCMIPGQERPPLVEFIPFERIIIDPLHCFLRISDKLIALMLEEALERQAGVCAQCHAGKKRLCAEACKCRCHVQVTRVIEGEMSRIGIPRFEFFEGKKKGDLDWTSLQGDENMAVLKKFNLDLIFSPERSQKIGSLWDQYIQINRSIHATLEELRGHILVLIPKDSLRGHGLPLPLHEISPAIENWKSSFLETSKGAPSDLQFNRGLYLESDLTPYMHALCAHMAEMLKFCAEQGLALAWFSASAQEKKNHLQVNFFFSKTFKGGLSESEASRSTMDAEGRLILRIFQNQHILQANHFDLHRLFTTPKPTKIYIPSNQKSKE